MTTATRTKATAAQKIATAVVAYEVTQLHENKRKVLTVDSIVKRYALDFGTYDYEGRTPILVAGQVVRNALNKEFKRGEIAHLTDEEGVLKRTKGGQIQFVFWDHQAQRLKGVRTWGA